MWFTRRSRSSLIYIFLTIVLVIIAVYLFWYSKPQYSIPIAPLLNITFFQTSNITEKYLHVDINLSTTSARCQRDDYLIIYVLSTVSNLERRKTIRSTWGSKRSGVCFVFIVGQVSGIINSITSIQKQVNDEKAQYQDIVEINHIESYGNVIYKEVAALIWSQRFYPDIPYLFKTDDDLTVDSILISTIAEMLAFNSSNGTSFLAKYRPALVENVMSANRAKFFRGGWAMDYQPTLRGGGKFGVSEEVWPYPVLPAYCSGFGWIMSKNIRNQLVEASRTYPVRKIAWIGDVFVSGFIARHARVKCTGIHIDYDQTASANCSCLMANNPLLTVCSSTFHTGGGGTEAQKYEEYRRAWRVIQLRHNLTHQAIENC